MASMTATMVEPGGAPEPAAGRTAPPLVVIGSGRLPRGVLEVAEDVVLLGVHQLEIVERLATPAAVLVAAAAHEEPAPGLVTSLRTRTCAPLVAILEGADERDRIAVLEVCADDCMEHTIGVGELLARLSAVGRRPGLGCARVAGGVQLDLFTREARVGGHPVELTRREFDLLALLVSSPRRVFTHKQVLHDVWGTDDELASTATVTEHVRRLRAKLRAVGGSDACIGTVRGVGYRFEPSRCTAHLVTTQ
jgi:DNA-binding response OmpR family regulator